MDSSMTVARPFGTFFAVAFALSVWRRWHKDDINAGRTWHFSAHCAVTALAFILLAIWGPR